MEEGKKVVEINKEIIFQELIKQINIVFSLPETCAVKIKNIVIEKIHNNEYLLELIKSAVESSYHDILSDIDMTVVVKLSPNDVIKPDQYMKMIDRYGITKVNYLGLVFVGENKMYRMILKNGMRYDFGFDFVYDENADNILTTTSVSSESGDEKWPVVNIDKFWFMQIQALAKLYRNDFLVSDHLANMNINETLVQQMVLRDIKYGTNHHRYGYQEELEYLQVDKTKCPYKKENEIFNMIAAKIFSASIAYDKLTLKFYPQFKERKEIFFAIWDCYEKALSIRS